MPASATTTGLSEAGLPEAAVTIVSTTDREAIDHLIKLDQQLDLIIPRGGPALIKRVLDGERAVARHFVAVSTNRKGVAAFGIDPATFEGKATDVRAAVAQAKRTKVLNMRNSNNNQLKKIAVLLMQNSKRLIKNNEQTRLL